MKPKLTENHNFLQSSDHIQDKIFKHNHTFNNEFDVRKNEQLP